MGRKSKKTDIVETAEELFSKFGLKRITVKEICKKSDVSKATFYNHFDNKNDLIKFIFNKLLEEGYEWLDELEKQDLSFKEEVQKIIEYKKEKATQMKSLFVSEYLDESPEMAEFYQNYKERSLKRSIEWVKRCQKEGKIREALHPKFIMKMFRMTIKMMKNEKLANLYQNYTQYIEEVFEFLFYGILPREDE